MFGLFKKHHENMHIAEVYTMTSALNNKLARFFSTTNGEYKQLPFDVKLPSNAYIFHSVKDAERLCTLLGCNPTNIDGLTIYKPYAVKNDTVGKDTALLYWTNQYDNMQYSKNEAFIDAEIKETDLVFDLSQSDTYSALSAYYDLWKFRNALDIGLDYTYSLGELKYEHLQGSPIPNKVQQLWLDSKFVDLIIKIEVLGEDDDLFVDLISRDSEWLESLFTPLREYTAYILDGCTTEPREPLDVSADLDKLAEWKSQLIHHMKAPK